MALQEFSDIHDLAKAADRIVEAQKINAQTVSATCTHPNNPRFHKNQTDAAKPTNKSLICYFHQRFGPRARRCLPGCLFAKLLSQLTSNQHKQENSSAGRH